MSKGTVTYDSNNSGGYWWLSDDDWFALEKAGWEVHWTKDKEFLSQFVDEDGRWLGALATSASKHDTTMAEAVEEWEKVTGESSASLGCSCCGTPHSFSFEGEDGTTEYWSTYADSGSRYGE